MAGSDEKRDLNEPSSPLTPKIDDHKSDADNSTGLWDRLKTVGNRMKEKASVEAFPEYVPPSPPPPKTDDQKSDGDESTPKVNDGWYYASEGEKHGPIEPEKLTSLLASGVIGRDTLVWRHGMNEWTPLDQTEIWASVPEAYSPPRHCQRDRKNDQVKNLLTKKNIEQSLDIGFWWLVRTAFKVLLYIGIGYILLNVIGVIAYVAILMMFPPPGHR